MAPLLDSYQTWCSGSLREEMFSSFKDQVQTASLCTNVSCSISKEICQIGAGVALDSKWSILICRSCGQE